MRFQVCQVMIVTKYWKHYSNFYQRPSANHHFHLNTLNAKRTHKILSDMLNVTRTTRTTSCKFFEFATISNFFNFETNIIFHTPSEFACAKWNGSDEYCWRNRADMILSTDGRMDRRTDRQGESSIPPFQVRWSGGYKNRIWNHKQWKHF